MFKYLNDENIVNHAVVINQHTSLWSHEEVDWDEDDMKIKL